MLKLMPLLLALAATPALSDTCEAVRSDIERKIRAAGVIELSVTVVESGASAPGKVVGNCAQGSKKIVYLRPQSAQSETAPPTAPATAPAISATAASKPETAPVLTECKDGSIAVGGKCKK